MAKILYGLCGVGIGHAIRAKIILTFLKRKHKVMVICSDRPYEYLSKRFNNVHKIEGFELGFRNNKISKCLTLIKNIRKISKRRYEHIRIDIEKIKKFNPEYVISDWETLSSYLSKNFNIPLISIDNQHFLMKGRFEFQKKYFFDYLMAKMVIFLLMKKADYYIISSFYKTKLKKEERNVFLVSPILRKEIIESKPAKKNYILVYQSTKTYHKLIKILEKINENFIIYGYDKREEEKNLKFKKFNEKSFLEDLKNCKAVICNGGFTLISEAMYLKKPLLTVTIKGHFEQLLNCSYVKKLGCGEYYKDLNKKRVESFINNLDKYTFPQKRKGNNTLFKILNKIIN